MISTIGKKVDQAQLKMGIKIELEHTTSKKIAERIAKQHLIEYPNYYTALKRMEKKLKKRKNYDSRKKS